MADTKLKQCLDRAYTELTKELKSRYINSLKRPSTELRPDKV
jgi:hypothetical protein